MPKQTISIFGAGGWGTTLGITLSRKPGNKVILWSPFPDLVKTINRQHQNKDFLPGIVLPDTLCVTTDTKKALLADILIFAIPVEYMRDTLKKIKLPGINFKKKIILSVSKGIEIKTLKLPSHIIKSELGLSDAQIVVLCGPNIAKEISHSMPAVASAASRNPEAAAGVQKIFKATTLRVYTHKDVIGVEIAAALKNIIAIACGISDGLGFGVNAKSALICRGLKEMERLAHAFGAKKGTLYGISGMGDLCTTCFSPFSRNRSIGQEVGSGKTLAKALDGVKTVAEGVTTVKAVNRLSKKLKIDMPITKEVFNVLYRNKLPLRAVQALMSRPLKSE